MQPTILVANFWIVTPSSDVGVPPKRR